jgi:hypothetical protein
MRKYLLSAVVFFIFNSFLFAELTKDKTWAISLTGIMTEINNSNRDSLNTNEMTQRWKNTWLTTLRRDWGITTRAELLETLDSMEKGGHAASFRVVKEIIYQVSNAENDAEITAILSKYEWDQTKINRFQYVYANWDKYQNCTLKAWDLGRNISLCRWGYTVGFITEDEAWEKIFRYARQIQSLYNSWEEYGYDYFRGRVFWASGFGEERSYISITEPIYKRLLNSYWGLLDWRVDLGQPVTAVQASTIRFLKPDDNDGKLQYRTNDPAVYNRAPYNLFPNPNVNPNIYECSVKKTSGNDDYGYGILFCVDDTDRNNISFYRFFININGRFAVQKWAGNTWAATPVTWRSSSFLRLGYNVYNTLKVERIDNENDTTFRIYINGNLAALFNDNTPVNGAKVGTVVSINVMEKEGFPYFPVDVRFNW